MPTPNVSPMKSLFETATRTGQPVPVSSPSRRVTSSECQVFLPKSWAGSMRIDSSLTPVASARSAWSTSAAVTSAATSAYAGRCGRVRGLRPPAWAQTRPIPRAAATSARRGSTPPHASLMRSAPAWPTASPTSARQVSTLMTTSGWRSRTAATSPATRSISSAGRTSSPGPAFTPPMSTMSAPSATAALAALSAAPNSLVAPRSKKESGVALTTAMMPNEPGDSASCPRRSVRDLVSATTDRG